MTASKWESQAQKSGRKASTAYKDEEHSLQGQHGKTHAVC